MNILVTGSSGFLGTVLCRSLQARGHRLTMIDSKTADLTRERSLDAYNDSRFDMIYHLAAWTQAGDFCLDHAGEQWIINQKLNTNVLSWWQKCNPQAKLICMGTSCAYDPALELKEENYMKGVPIESLFAYAMTKRMLYAGCEALRKQFGMKYLCLVPSTLFGPGYRIDGRQMHFIFDLVRKILRGKIFGEPVVLWGDGYQKREIVFIDDFVRITLELADRCENDIVNIGAGEEFTIRQFAGKICEITGYDLGKIRFDSSKYVGARSKCLDVSKLKGLLPGETLTPMEDGLRKTIEWFKTADPGLSS